MAHNSNNPTTNSKSENALQQSLYPPFSSRRTWTAGIITLLIIGAGVWAFYAMLG